MAVRKTSARHFSFLLGRAASRALPGMRARMPFYDCIVPLIEAGRVESFSETQELALDARDAAFARHLPQPLPARIARDVALIELNDVKVLGATGAIVDDKRECLFLPRGARDFATYHNFRSVPSKLVMKEPANYFHMLGAFRGHRHFFHFLSDRLPRLYYLLERFALGREPIVVLTNADLPQFQRDIYGFLAARHPNLRFVGVPRDERWRLPTLYAMDDYQPIKRTFANKRTLEFVRRLIFEGYGLKDLPAKRRLYVTRNDTKKRRIANEVELLPILARHGFEIVAPGQLSFRDQVALFMQAEVIAGPHGAGLTNILFAPESACVLEIFPANKVKNTYFLLAKSLGQTYRGLIGGKGGHQEWFRVDAGEFESALKSICR